VDTVEVKQNEEFDKRSNAFIEVFDYAQENGIELDSPEFLQLSRFATSEFGIAQKVENLADIKVELLSDYEFKRVISRARSGIKQLIEQRRKFAPIIKKINGEKITVGVAGPYYSNRAQRRAVMRRLLKSERATIRPSRASEIVDKSKAKRTILGESKS
jgi:hypothetical protein